MAGPTRWRVAEAITSDDYNGNALTKVVGSNTTSYAWDFENRMTSVTLPGSGGTVSFKYDPFGRRIYKSSSSGTSVFAYDGDNLIEETNSSGTAVARYSQGLNIDEPLAMLRSSTTSYYQADGLGSITSLSNGAGALAQTYTFDSFGKQTATSGSLTNPFQYTARESDAETGLYYYRARYYDESIGRFLAEDPLGIYGGIDLYGYVGDEPVRRADPFGLTWVYSQGSGALYYVWDNFGDPDPTHTIVVLVGSGYAGHGSGVNNPGSQCVQGDPNHPDTNAGPPPRGGYTIGPLQNNRSADGSRTFRNSLRLTPDPNNDMCNPTRAGFLIHGSNDPSQKNASQGCVILPPDVRKKIGQSPDKRFKVVP